MQLNIFLKSFIPKLFIETVPVKRRPKSQLECLSHKLLSYVNEYTRGPLSPWQHDMKTSGKLADSALNSFFKAGLREEL